MNNEIKLLLLGAGESGKSTVAKQMKIIHMHGFSVDERLAYKSIIYANTLSSMRAILNAAKGFDIEWSEELAPLVTNLMQDSGPYYSGPISAEIGAELATLWAAESVKQVYERQSEYQLNDSAKYYFDNVARIAQEDYVPSEQDVLRSRAKTTGIIETQFEVNGVKFRMCDVGGQRSERKKWMHCVAGDTLVARADGTALPIAALAEAGTCVAPSIMTRSLEHGITQTELIDAWCTGAKSVVAVELASGHRLVCTPDHRVQLGDGAWCAAAQLLPQHHTVSVSAARAYPVSATVPAAVLAAARLHGAVAAAAPAGALRLESSRDVAAVLRDAALVGVKAHEASTLSEGAPVVLLSFDSAAQEQLATSAAEALGEAAGQQEFAAAWLGQRLTVHSDGFASVAAEELPEAVRQALSGHEGGAARAESSARRPVDVSAVYNSTGVRYATRLAAQLALAAAVHTMTGGQRLSEAKVAEMAESLGAAGWLGTAGVPACQGEGAPCLQVPVREVVPLEDPVPVYDLAVRDPSHAFVANDVVAHNCFQDVTACIFCVALSEYDLKLYEDEKTNRMQESLKLFREICNSKWFVQTAMILFLNKRDLFEQKIKETSLSVAFEDYQGGNDYEEALTFITDKFLSQNENPRKPIYPHAICATDTDNVQHVFNAVQDVVLRKALEDPML